jgi:ribosomal protein S7
MVVLQRKYMSPLRRVNYALYLIATGAREASFRNRKTMAECLAEELINAASGDFVQLVCYQEE